MTIPPRTINTQPSAFDGGALNRRVEPKISLEGDWMDRRRDAGEGAAQHRLASDADFDISAWFALADAEDAQSRRMTECWYG